MRSHSYSSRRRPPSSVLLASVLVLLAVQHGRTGRTAQAQSRRSAAGVDLLDEKSASAHWDQGRVGLRTGLTRLAEAHQVSLFLDRRIDPDTALTESFPLQPLRTLFAAIGERHGFGVATLENVVYVGPLESARRLKTIDHLRRQELQSLPTQRRSDILAADTLQWDELATPRELVEQVSRRSRVSVANPEMIPHDLWAAGRLPNVGRSTQLTILLTGFDLTYSCSSQGVLTLRPVQDDELWEQAYPLSPGGAAMAQQMQEHFPDATIKLEPRRILVTGFVEDHEAIRRWLQTGGPVAESRPPSRAVDAASRRFSLRVVRKPLRDVLRAIENDTGLHITTDEASAESVDRALGQLVSFEVRDADVDGLLEAGLKQVGLQHKRDGANVEVFAPGR